MHRIFEHIVIPTVLLQIIFFLIILFKKKKYNLFIKREKAKWILKDNDFYENEIKIKEYIHPYFDCFFLGTLWIALIIFFAVSFMETYFYIYAILSILMLITLYHHVILYISYEKILVISNSSFYILSTKNNLILETIDRSEIDKMKSIYFGFRGVPIHKTIIYFKDNSKPVILFGVTAHSFHEEEIG